MQLDLIPSEKPLKPRRSAQSARFWQAEHQTWLPAPPCECGPGNPMGQATDVWAWVKSIIEAAGERAKDKP